MEVYYQRSGFQPRVENVAIHSRKRYRLVPPANQDPSLPPADPTLWIVHYAPAENQDRLPANRVPITQETQNSLSQREYIRQHGQLVRKDFMLYDGNNWPIVNMPGGASSGQPLPAMAYPNNVMAQMNRNQQPYMMPQHAMNQPGVGPPAPKRPRQIGPSHGHGPSRAIPQVPQPSTLDEEDIGTGDAMDTLTPRDISANRYMLHHEWMEEIFSSPYGTSQIVPVELGLGRKGEIESLTREFFNAPTSDVSPTSKDAAPAQVGRLEPGKAEDFSRQATQRVGQIQAEMERLKRQHARRMSKLNNGLAIKEAERKLRSLGTSGSDKIGRSQPAKVPSSGVDEILGRVEIELGKSIKNLEEISCVQKGGLEEKPPVSEGGLRDFDLEGTADFNEQQAHATLYPASQPSSSRGYGSAGQTPHDFAIQHPATGGGASKHEQAPVIPTRGVSTAEVPSETASKDAETGDWIMVEKEGEPIGQGNQATPDVDSIMNDAALEGNLDTPGHDLNTAGEALQDFAPDSTADAPEDFNPNDFGDAVDFGNLETASEALSGFVANTDLHLDEHGDLTLDDSAFGEAFAATEPSEAPGGLGPEP